MEEDGLKNRNKGWDGIDDEKTDQRKGWERAMIMGMSFKMNWGTRWLQKWADLWMDCMMTNNDYDYGPRITYSYLPNYPTLHAFYNQTYLFQEVAEPNFSA